MAEITASAVKALRELTDLPMMKCKQALQQAEGDQEKAIEILRQEAGKLKLKLNERSTSEGRIAVAVQDDGLAASIIEFQCETAPVAANDDFKNLTNLCAKQLLEGPGAETPDELLAQSAPDGSGQTLNDLYEEIINKIREKMVLARVARVEGPVGGYVHHDGKTGVLFQASGDNASSPVLRDVAMHIAALKPQVTYPEELDPQEVQAERDRLTEEARATGKPDNIIEKIVDGRMKNFYVEKGVLVVQPFAKDDSKTVSQALAEAGLKAKSFVRWFVGS